MILTKEKLGSIGSFKLGYSRGLPSYMAPKIFEHKKTEEYFVASLFAQVLLQNKFPIIGVEVCENDSDKGADALIRILDSVPKKIQITRFTLTEYLRRRKLAEEKVESLIDKILGLTKVESPVNITINVDSTKNVPLNTQKMENLLAKFIADLISQNQAELASSNKYINCPVIDEKLKTFTPIITLQGIPTGFYSNFFGRDNIFIDLDFDNINFSKDDIDKECLNIYDKKNGGRANILLIWADTWEILDDPKYIIERLRIQFEQTTFEEAIFFNFYNRLDLYMNQPIGIAEIKIAK